ncbi:FAD-dependent monooxygenase [Ramlibacter sp. AN1015]|uniref:FAD-dependent monooxygenase n=1 Tax=Ramlibacter sp. AN1015 TaxID=3133428 RepID=UPI0030C188E0
MRDMTTSRILVAGAGIGGLTAALCLAQRGFQVQVFEQASALKALGAGLQLSANATRVLFTLGLGEAVQALTILPGKKCIRLWNTGQEWELFDLGRESIERYGYPYMMLYRPDLHGELVRALNERCPGALQLDAKVVEVRQDAREVELVLQDGRRVRGDVLIGADGVHSVARAAAIAEDKPVFSGCTAWRGVIEVQRLPPRLREPAGVNWVGPGAHIVHYPVHAGRLISLTGIVEKEGWFRESWTEEGSIEECLQDFAGWHEDVQCLLRQIAVPLRWAMMVREPLTNWTNGRISLLGDAAHPTLPFLAQGAGMAIEDACVLARALEQHADDLSLGLRVYQASRIERTTRIVQGSAANAHRFHNRALATPEGAQAYIAGAWEQDKVRAQYHWLFSYCPESVPLEQPPPAPDATSAHA